MTLAQYNERREAIATSILLLSEDLLEPENRPPEWNGRQWGGIHNRLNIAYFIIGHKLLNPDEMRKLSDEWQDAGLEEERCN